jgi:1-acyl-sn-glycerol-3-phosphate acyltransferase
VNALQCSRRAPGRSAVFTLFWWTLVRLGLWFLFRVLYRLRMEGQDRIPARGALVFVANHQSHLDPVIVGILVHDRPFASMARASLFRFPLGPLIRTLNAIPLERGRGDHGALRAAHQELLAGRTVLIFPEGTRTRDGSLGAFQRGALLLARRASAAIVPVAIEGAHEVWPRGRATPKWRGRIAVAAGEPIPAADILAQSDDAILERLRSEIAALQRALREHAR